MMQDTGALVLGGGLGGSMVALELARAGRRVIVVEKSKTVHDKECGEFLSSESLLYLKRHGIDASAFGGVPIRSVRLITSSFATESELPFEAFALTRRKLDEELLRLVAEAGAEVHRGATVERLERDGRKWSAHLRGGGAMQAEDVFLATGKHDLRGWGRPAGTHAGLVAFKMYYRLTAAQQAALGDAVELVLFPGGYAGLQPVEDGVVNLSLLVTADRLRRAGSNWENLLNYLLEQSAHLAQRLTAAESLLRAPLAVSQIPYGHVQRSAESGLWRVGDQAAVIPSFCGDGMAIALHSGALAAAHLLQDRSSASYQRMLYRQLNSRLWFATKLSQMLVSWPQGAQFVRLFPGLLRQIASMTRIPDGAIVQAERWHRV